MNPFAHLRDKITRNTEDTIYDPAMLSDESIFLHYSKEELMSNPNVNRILDMHDPVIPAEEMEVRILNEKGKVVKVDKVIASYERAGLYLKNYQPEYDVMILPNPVEKDPYLQDDFLTKDERRIKKFRRIVLDIDYNFDDYIEPVINTLIAGKWGITMDNLFVFRTASNKIRISIPLDTNFSRLMIEGSIIQGDINKALIHYIKCARYFVYEYNQALKEVAGIEVDTTFVHNINHPVFIERRPIHLKGGKSSQLVYEAKTTYDLIDLWIKKYYLKFDEVFGKKNNPPPKQRKKKDKEKSKDKKDEKTIVSWLDEDAIEIVEKQVLQLEEKLKKRKKKIISSDKSSYREHLACHFKDVFDGEKINLPDNPFKRNTKLWQDMRSKLPDFFDDKVVDLEYNRKVYNYFREAFSSLHFFTTTFKGEDKSANRYKNVIFPAINLMVYCFGSEYVESTKLYKLAVELCYYHNTKEKENLVEDIELALTQAEDNEKDLRPEIDKIYQRYFSYKTFKSSMYIAQLFIDLSKKVLPTSLRKKEIKERYQMSDSAFRTMMTVLKNFVKLGNLHIEIKHREIIFHEIPSPESIYVLLYSDKFVIADYVVNKKLLFKKQSREKSFNSKDLDYFIFSIYDRILSEGYTENQAHFFIHYFSDFIQQDYGQDLQIKQKIIQLFIEYLNAKDILQQKKLLRRKIDIQQYYKEFKEEMLGEVVDSISQSKVA